MGIVAVLAVAFAIGAFIAGILTGPDAVQTRAEVDRRVGVPEGVVWVGFTAAIAALMVVFAGTTPLTARAVKRLGLALGTAGVAAGLVSACFWIGVKIAHPDPCFSRDEPCIYTGGYVFTWGIFAAVMAVVGVAAWGFTRMVFRVRNR